MENNKSLFQTTTLQQDEVEVVSKFFCCVSSGRGYWYIETMLEESSCHEEFESQKFNPQNHRVVLLVFVDGVVFEPAKISRLHTSIVQAAHDVTVSFTMLQNTSRSASNLRGLRCVHHIKNQQH